MKKLLLILFLIPTLAGGQVPNQKPSRNFRGSLPTSPPTGFNKNQDLWMNTNDNKGYFWSGSAWYADTITTKLYQGIKGDTGAAGPPGSDGRDGVCPSCPPGGGGGGTFSGYFPFIVVISNGVDDRAQLQAAVDSQYVNGKDIHGIGILKTSGGIKYKADHRYGKLTGGFDLRCISSTEFTVFYSDTPISVAQAEGTMTNRRLYFEQFTISGLDYKQTGFNLYAGEGNIAYSHVTCYGMKLGWNNVFQLRCYDWYCAAINCIEGMRITSGNNGNIPGGTYANSSSNGYDSYHFRFVGAPNGLSTIGITVNDAKNVNVWSPVIEGHYFIAGVFWNATAPTAEGAQIHNLHGEMGSLTNPNLPKVPGKAYIVLRSGTKTHIIKSMDIGNPGVQILVENVGGYPNVNVCDMESGKVPNNGVGIFTTVNGANWKFTNCDDPFTVASIPAMFTPFSGFSIKQACGRGTGANNWCIENTVNRQ